MKRRFRKLGAMLIAVLMIVSIFSTTAFATITALPDGESERVLNIYKYSPIGTPGDAGDGTINEDAAKDRVPLKDVEFELYKVEADGTSRKPADDGVSVDDNYVVTIPTELKATHTATIKTNAAGLAQYSFGTGTANDGTYLVIEKKNEAVATPVAPFYVSIPLTNPDETEWMYDVTVYPKNDVPDGPEVDKDVTTIGNNSTSADIGEINTWIIRGEVPTDLYRTVGTAPNIEDVYAVNYSFSDTLNSALTYKGNLIVKLYTKAGAEITLSNSHYDTTGTSNVDTAGGQIEVKLTDAGKKYIMENLGTGDVAPEIRVYFDTVINDTAVLATNIVNDVTLNYTNSSNNRYEPTTVPPNEIPEVHTGGLAIEKVDIKDQNKKLPNATFKIARDATDAEIADSAISKETITVGGETKTVVFVDFYDTASIEGATVTEVTTNSNGAAVINGLAYGNYYLIEIKAPDGYNLLSNPFPVTVNASSHETTNAVKVQNSSKFELPVTGGAGTVLFTMGGILLIGMAGIIFALTKKKKSSAK